ncbi:helix-turn-helix domain-containing protein [Pimelobacter simplex]|uniref:helix-turn-helix domain-containing protein n=1 Tax=Nocardioides simplex TaxID=2045 RepID=UPI00214FFE23|nr:helix-turn-helix domain-containing protein [Pimelobacter simplex]UUW88365.1 hypothetical protein M0M43_21835 [Pimelobacter simplex]UUW97869.1 hypothetical protein M0M48_10480 [Pimelobacter simplex]
MSPDERAAEALPTAAALVCAVADRDQAEVHRILGQVDDWPALAVVLAGHVSPDSALGLVGQLSPETKAVTILRAAAIQFGTTIAAIRSDSRQRAVLDARAVAMAAMRYAGLSSSFVGRQTNRDHSTVLHAAGRVGENPVLRKAALTMAALVAERGAELGDIDDDQRAAVA